MNKLVSDLKDLKGSTDKNRALFRESLELAMMAVNSSEFKELALNFSFIWHGEKLNRFHKPYSAAWEKASNLPPKTYLSNKTIYSIFMSGWDKFNLTEDNDLDVESFLYYRRNSTIGYTYANTIKTWINTRFWNTSSSRLDATKALIAANIIHEYMHNLGFGHAQKWNTYRDFTVPYAYGDFVKELVLKILKEDRGDVVANPTKPSTYKTVCRRPWYYLGLVRVCNKVKVND